MPGMGKSSRRCSNKQKSQKRAHKYLHLGTHRPVRVSIPGRPFEPEKRKRLFLNRLQILTAGLLAPGPLTPPSQSQTSGTLSEELGPLQSRGRRRHRPKWPTGFPFHAAFQPRTVALSVSGLPGEINAPPRICRMTRGPVLR